MRESGDDSGVAAVETVELARRFGRRWALRGVSLRVDPGSAVALVGPNGSGKTTLLRLLTTALRPSRGSARVFGCDVLRSPAAVRAQVGMLAHAPGLYEDLTAGENLRFALRMWGMDAAPARITAALAAVNLEHEEQERVRGFSSGMRRRLALARLLLRPPRLLLLDEPYASFDAAGMRQVHRLVRDIAADGGAVLLATHDRERAAEVVDRFVELQAGRVLNGASATAPAAGLGSRSAGWGG
ncbi:MAG: heme ABC exporter ATP-binding protein CcmA [Gemmatimonadetes bacterium]|nr:heme ABC exporter ATP-binding protein CcmA [Gemmatimonadota bacterium]